jgi:hypothetical protein
MYVGLFLAFSNAGWAGSSCGGLQSLQSVSCLTEAVQSFSARSLSA